MSSRTFALRFDDLDVESFFPAAEATTAAYYEGDTTSPCKILLQTIKTCGGETCAVTACGPYACA